MNTISDDLTILQVDRSQENPCVLCEMFGKSDVRRKSIVTLALSKIIARLSQDILQIGPQLSNASTSIKLNYI